MTNPAMQRTQDEIQVAYSYCLSHLAHLGDRSALWACVTHPRAKFLVRVLALDPGKFSRNVRLSFINCHHFSVPKLDLTPFERGGHTMIR